MSQKNRNEIDSNDKFAELAVWWARSASSGGGGGSIPIIATNIAALEAVPSTSLKTGQLAYVQSVGALWSLQSTSALTADGITIVPALNGGQWLRGPSLITQAATAQLFWAVDPANSSLVASDENPGTALLPLLSKAEIARRLGTLSPRYSAVNVVVQMLSADPNGNDPWLFKPNLLNNANMTLEAVLPAPSFTGTLNVVTAKNRSSNQALQTSFTTATGAVVTNMMLVNATRGNSRAFAWRNAGGGNWILTQPMTPVSLGSLNVHSEVDSWASGDAITGYVLLNVNVGVIGGNTPQINDPDTNGVGIYQCTIQDYSHSLGDGILPINDVLNWFISECVVQVFPIGGFFNDEDYPTSGTYNTVMNDGCSLSGLQVSAGGGKNFGTELINCKLLNDFYFGTSGGSFKFCALTSNSVFFDNAFLDVESSSTVFGGSFYGSGILNVTQSPFTYSGTPASVFNGITLELQGKTTAYSMVTSGGVVTVHGGIALTAANLAAAAGASGFGGTATNLAGASITNGTQP